MGIGLGFIDRIKCIYAVIRRINIICIYRNCNAKRCFIDRLYEFYSINQSVLKILLYLLDFLQVSHQLLVLKHAYRS